MSVTRGDKGAVRFTREESGGQVEQGRFFVGLDLGCTSTAAAIGGPSGPARPVAMGRDGVVASVLAFDAAGAPVVGDAAGRLARTEPTRVLRDVVGRAGDPVPIVVAGRSLAAGTAVALLLTRVVEEVAARRGAPPETVAFAHPAWWGPDEVGPVLAALRHEGRAMTAVPAPTAAIAARGRPDGSGGPVAVLDVDGQITASIVRGTGTRPGELLGPPSTELHPTGAPVDDSVLAHVRDALGAAWSRLDPGDPAVRGAIADLRHRCAQATVALSREPSADVAVDLPGLRTRVPLGREHVTGLLLPLAVEAGQTLADALGAAGVDPDRLDDIVLTGRSARFSLFAEVLGTVLGRPVVAAPPHAAALGAVLLCEADARDVPAVAAARGIGATVPAPRPARGGRVRQPRLTAAFRTASAGSAHARPLVAGRSTVVAPP